MAQRSAPTAATRVGVNANMLSTGQSAACHRRTTPPMRTSNAAALPDADPTKTDMPLTATVCNTPNPVVTSRLPNELCWDGKPHTARHSANVQAPPYLTRKSKHATDVWDAVTSTGDAASSSCDPAGGGTPRCVEEKKSAQVRNGAMATNGDAGGSCNSKQRPDVVSHTDKPPPSTAKCRPWLRQANALT